MSFWCIMCPKILPHIGVSSIIRLIIWPRTWLIYIYIELYPRVNYNFCLILRWKQLLFRHLGRGKKLFMLKGLNFQPVSPEPQNGVPLIIPLTGEETLRGSGLTCINWGSTRIHHRKTRLENARKRFSTSRVSSRSVSLSCMP